MKAPNPTSNFSKGSLALSDAIFEALQDKIGDLQRAGIQAGCRLFQEGQAGFAYVFYQRTGNAVVVSCRGELQGLKAAARGSRLKIQPRKSQKGGWAKHYKCHFRVERKSQADAVARILHEVSFPLTAKNQPVSEHSQVIIPLTDELAPDVTYPEGAVTQILVNKYERNPEARTQCVKRHGLDCIVCGFNFEKQYGEIGEGFIHVHHLTLISSIRKQYQVNPRTDLCPVCANCHAMLHRKDPPLSIPELQQQMKTMKIKKRK